VETSDSGLNIYPDAVTCGGMRLIGPRCDQLGPTGTVCLKSPGGKTNSFCLHKTGF